MMRLLLVCAGYPHAAAQWIGAQNENSALALREIVGHIEVLSPRPYAPRVLAFNERWRSYVLAPTVQIQRGIEVHRPAYPRLPRILQAFWPTTGAFFFCRRLVERLHAEFAFHGILSFDLAGAGGLAWRLGRYLGIPAWGWATGSDIRWNANSPIGRSVKETLGKLDLVFYQSGELKMLGAQLLGVAPERLEAERHIVQSRGVSEPNTMPDEAIRRSVRATLGIADSQILVLYLGRMVHDKGVFDLVEGFAKWASIRPDLMLVLVGSRPGHDETPELQKRIRSLPGMEQRISILPGCEPDYVWRYFRAADVFAFPSFKEGMPNSLLQAMLAGLPAVAFSIPPVQEITHWDNGLLAITPFDFSSFGEAILMLAANPLARHEIGARGQGIVREHFSVRNTMRSVIGHIERVGLTCL